MGILTTAKTVGKFFVTLFNPLGSRSLAGGYGDADLAALTLDGEQAGGDPPEDSAETNELEPLTERIGL